MRRSMGIGAVLSAALLAAAVPFLGSASAAPCPSWTDPAGDAYFLEVEDGTVDITNVLVESSATGLTTTFTVPKLASVNDTSAGDRFELLVDAGGLALSIWAERDDLDAEAQLQGMVGATGPAGTKRGGTASWDVKAHKVVIAMPYAMIDGALGKPFAGLTAKSLVGQVVVQTGPFTSNAYDKAPAPAGVTFVGGQACGGSGAPAPTTTAAPQPSQPSPSTPPASAFPAGLPAAGCFHVADAVGDAKVNGQVPNDPDLDITGLTLRATDGWVLAYMKADKLAAGPSAADGHRYSIDFVFNKHLFTVAASSYKTAASKDVREGLASTGRNGHMVQMSVDTVSALGAAYVAGQVTPPFVASGSQASFDTKTGYVTIAIPVADIEKYGEAKLSGALTGVTGKAALDYWRNSLGADTTADANASASTFAWTVGDNKCFPRPVATAMTLSVAKAGSTRTVTARLTSAGKPLAGQVVTWFVNGKKVGTSTTSTAGTAVLKTAKPTQTVTAEFAGVNDKYLPSKATTRV